MRNIEDVLCPTFPLKKNFNKQWEDSYNNDSVRSTAVSVSWTRNELTE